MSTATANTNSKQVKPASTDRLNGKIKLQNKLDASAASASSNVVVNGSTTTSSTASATAKSTAQGGQVEGMSPEQRRRVSGRPQMTAEEQKIALRKRASPSDV